MDNKEFGKQMEKRTLDFAMNVIDLSCTRPDTPEARVIRYQFTKAGTSVGANYREANRARSKKDFVHKIKICETEASESEFWLIAIERKKWGNRKMAHFLLKEAGELLAIFNSIGKNLK